MRCWVEQVTGVGGGTASLLNYPNCPEAGPHVMRICSVLEREREGERERERNGRPTMQMQMQMHGDASSEGVCMSVVLPDPPP